MVKNNKRGQSLPINAIIIAALAMIVLVVVAAIFTGRARIFAKDLESCSAKQGKCEKTCGSGKAIVTNVKCPETKQEEKEGKNVCCITVLEQ